MGCPGWALGDPTPCPGSGLESPDGRWAMSIELWCSMSRPRSRVGVGAAAVCTACGRTRHAPLCGGGARPIVSEGERPSEIERRPGALR
eukprot:5779847-Prymnesium_polylepis.1